MALILKKSEHPQTITLLSVIGMLTALGSASINTIWAVYLNSFFQNDVYVGLFSSILTIVAFASYFVFIPIIEKRDKAKIYTFSLILFTAFYVLFAINTSFIFMAILAIIMTAMISLRITSYGILVKQLSNKQNLSSNEGLVYTYANIAFVLGPLIAGFISAKFGFKWVFLLSAIFMLIGFIIFKSSKITGEKGKKRLDKNIFKNFKDFFKKKDRVIAYFISSGITMWWTLIYLFVPLYIIRQGMHELTIGIFLFAVAVPLIALEILFSNKAGKHGFKKIFKTAYLLIAAISVLAFFFSNIYVVLSLLVLASVGLAMLEPTTQAYFFDILKGKEQYRYYGPYNTCMDTGGLIAKLSGTALLVFLPFKFIFLLFGGFMFIMFLLSFKARSVNESKRKL
ncbi:MAG: MFS transporter [Nanoarchaeota archaeon]|nr:MFS transporter [Nanoarchaeota archaeon]